MDQRITRRGALATGTLSAIGIGLLAAAGAIPEPPNPVAVEPPPPWLTVDPELVPILERLARAVAAYPGEMQQVYGLLDSQVDFIETVTRTWNDRHPGRA